MSSPGCTNISSFAYNPIDLLANVSFKVPKLLQASNSNKVFCPIMRSKSSIISNKYATISKTWPENLTIKCMHLFILMTLLSPNFIGTGSFKGYIGYFCKILCAL